MVRPKLPKCPDVWHVFFARQLLAALGADVTPIRDGWCWEDFARQYQAYRSAVEAYLEQARTGDPAWGAYCLAHYCGSNRSWAEGVIERALALGLGHAEWAAENMVRYCGSDLAWAERLIERIAATGLKDAIWAAQRMVFYCGSSHAWAETIIARVSRMSRACGQV